MQLCCVLISTSNIKNQRFKNYQYRDCKKTNKQGSRYCSFESVECHMTGDTVQLAFNYLSYKSLFDSAMQIPYTSKHLRGKIFVVHHKSLICRENFRG